MANEIEKKWLVDARLMDLDVFRSAGLEIKEMEQGYLPACDLELEDEALSIGGISFPINAGTRLDILCNICDAYGVFPNGMELRWRVSSSNRAPAQGVVTLKGRVSPSGSERAEVEFRVDSALLAEAKKLSKNGISKSRVLVPISGGVLEVDFYRRPAFPFVSIEKEFYSQEELAAFRLPAYIERLRPIDATGIGAFKNRALSAEPSGAAGEWHRIADGGFSHLTYFPAGSDPVAVGLYRHWLDIDWYKKTLRWRDLAERTGAYEESDPEHSMLLAMIEWFSTVWDKDADEGGLVRKMEYALDHDLPEFVTGDITWEAIALLPPDKRAEMQDMKAAAENRATGILLAHLPDGAARAKSALWRGYDEQRPDDAAARSVKGNDKVASLMGASFRDWDSSKMTQPGKYAGKALSLVPPPGYFTLAALERLPSFMHPDGLEARLAARDAQLPPDVVGEMRSTVRFLNETFGIQDEKRFAKGRGEARGESVADHTWRLAYMLSTFAAEFRMPDGFDYARALKMVMIHDLAEIRTSDIPHEDVFSGEITKAEKHKIEERALSALTRNLPDRLRAEIMDLWQEYEETATPTGAFVRALDKIEATTHVLAEGISYNPGIRGLHGNEYYAKVPELWPMVDIMKSQLRADYARRGYEWKPGFDGWKPQGAGNCSAARAASVLSVSSVAHTR